jgi:hypothetical protein
VQLFFQKVLKRDLAEIVRVGELHTEEAEQNKSVVCRGFLSSSIFSSGGGAVCIHPIVQRGALGRFWIFGFLG